MKRTLLAIVLLASCSRQPATPPANQAEATAPTPEPVEPAPKSFVFDEKTDLMEFHYAWPAEAAAIPQLVAKLRSDMAGAKTELLTEAQAGARESKQFSDKEGVPFNGKKSAARRSAAATCSMNALS